jgi:hypothetical protein
MRSLFKYLILLFIFIQTILADGIDTTFSTDGYDNNALSGTAWPGKIVVDDNGVITVAGRHQDGTNSVKVIQYSADGNTKTIDVNVPSDYDGVPALLLDDDNIPIVAGKMSGAVNGGKTTRVAKIDANGFFSGFNSTNGYIDLSFTSNLGTYAQQRPQYLYKLSNGRIIVVGGSFNDAAYDEIALYQLNADGTQYTAGEQYYNLNRTYNPIGMYEDTVNSHLYFVAYEYGGTYVSLFRTDINGSLDTSFGSNGVLEYNPNVIIDTENVNTISSFFLNNNFYIPINNQVIKISLDGSFSTFYTGINTILTALDGDKYGNIYLVGTTNTNGTPKYQVWKLSSDGSIDSSFGSSGLVEITGATNDDYAIDVSDSGEYIAIVGDAYNVARFKATVPKTHVVSSSADSGVGTLRQTILDANSGDTIDLSSLGGQTITLSSPIDINKSLTIEGNNTNPIILDGGSSTQIFTSTSAIDFTISNLILQNGTNGSLSGGAISFNNASASFTANSIVFKNNTAGWGGAVWSGSTPLKFVNSHFERNIGSVNGGSAIYADASVEIIQSSFIDNNASGNHGGAVNAYETNFINSTCSGNIANSGAIGGACLYKKRCINSNKFYYCKQFYNW